MTTDFQPTYSRWRHGGWYVDNVRYPSGATGCVSNNYADKKWRIACGPQDITFPSRDAAARAEYTYVMGLKVVQTQPDSAAHRTQRRSAVLVRREG